MLTTRSGYAADVCLIRLSILRVPDSGPTAYAISQVTLNCASLKNQTVSGTNYSSDGKASPFEGEAESAPIKPGTLGDVLKRYICDGVDPYPRSKSIKALMPRSPRPMT